MNLKIASPFLTSLVLCVHVLCAQQYLFTRYTSKDGLVNNRARFMYQDSKGRLYISTFGGLSVYDGSRFINYTTENGLITSLVNDILEAGEDSLLIAPNGDGFHCMVHGVIRNIPTADHYYPVVNQLLRGTDGTLYGIADQGLFRWAQDHWKKIPLPDNRGRDDARNITQGIEWNHRLILLTDPNLGGYPGSSMLLIYDPGRNKLIIPDSSADAYYMTRSPDGEFIVATRWGVRRLDTVALLHNVIRLIPLDAVYRAADSVIAGYLYFDRAKNFWLAAEKKVMRINANGDLQTFGAANGLPAGFNNSVFRDGENNIWFTNDQNGITKLASEEVAFFSTPAAGFIPTDVFGDGNSDSAWFYDGLDHRLLLASRTGQRLFRGTGNLPSVGQIAIHNTPEGRQAYIIYDFGLYALHFLPGDRYASSLVLRDPPAPGDPNPGDYAYAGFDRKGALVVSGNKLITLRDGKIHRVLLPYRADQAAIDAQNRIWVATRSGMLCVYGRGPSDTAIQLLHTWSAELPRIGPRSIAIDKQGRVWVGTRDHGLFCFIFNGLKLLSWQQLTIKNGLSENFVNYLLCDPDNTIWVCTPSGLDRIRTANGSFILDNITRSNAFSQSIYKVMPGGRGVHWALVKGGVIRIGNPPDRPAEYRPSVLFSKMLAGNEPIAAPGGSAGPDKDKAREKAITLPYTRNSISAYVGTTSFIDETQTRYSYLLEGSSGAQWSEPNPESSIQLIDLPPGKYTLKVKAQFLTGRYHEQEGDYPFIILPPWWRTWWFRAVVLCLLVVIGVILTRVYTRRKLEKQRIALEKRQAVEKERTRIATDMHDDLGAGLSRIKFLSETIGIRQQQSLPIEEEISGIRQYSHEMIDKMGEIVWALNEKNDSLSDLLSYTRSYAVEYLMQAGLDCTAAAPENLPSRNVSGEFRRNVYLTVKEALHNIVKHAQAGKVVIGMEVGDHLVITIRDDGIGFDKNRVRPFGNGLTNMEKRVRDIGGELVILKEKGTTVRLTVPI